MQNTKHAISVCQQIQRLGKTPSVALIRQYASRPLTIPEIVKALQIYKNSPQVVESEAGEDGLNTSPSLAERVATLEAQVAALSSKLETLSRT